VHGAGVVKSSRQTRQWLSIATAAQITHSTISDDIRAGEAWVHTDPLCTMSGQIVALGFLLLALYFNGEAQGDDVEAVTRSVHTPQ
jgi:hypothetical protein